MCVRNRDLLRPAIGRSAIAPVPVERTLPAVLRSLSVSCRRVSMPACLSTASVFSVLGCGTATRAAHAASFPASPAARSHSPACESRLQLLITVFASAARAAPAMLPVLHRRHRFGALSGAATSSSFLPAVTRETGGAAEAQHLFDRPVRPLLLDRLCRAPWSSRAPPSWPRDNRCREIARDRRRFPANKSDARRCCSQSCEISVRHAAQNVRRQMRHLTHGRIRKRVL